MTCSHTWNRSAERQASIVHLIFFQHRCTSFNVKSYMMNKSWTQLKVTGMGLTELLTNWVTWHIHAQVFVGSAKGFQKTSVIFFWVFWKINFSFMKYLRDFSFFLIVYTIIASSFLSVLMRLKHRLLTSVRCLWTTMGTIYMYVYTYLENVNSRCCTLQLRPNWISLAYHFFLKHLAFPDFWSDSMGIFYAIYPIKSQA